MASEPIPISFDLHIVDGLVDWEEEKFTVATVNGKTLFEALKTFQESNDKFKLQTKNVPNISHNVVSVMEKGNKTNQFWEILLRQPKGEDIIPINLDYKVNSGDTVFLQFTPILFLSSKK